MKIAEMAALSSKAKVNIMMHYMRESSFRYQDDSSLFIKAEQKLLSARPDVRAQVNIVGQHIRDNVFESTMDIDMRVSMNNAVIYELRVVYSTVFTIDNADGYDDSVKKYIATVTAPYMMFPFARKVIFDITQNSGMMPIAMDPMDFAKMYEDAQNRAEANNKKDVFTDEYDN